jgi:hypothetical protein
MEKQMGLMIIFLALGGIANQVQIIQAKKPFLSRTQFNLVSFGGFVSFLAGVFIALKSVFPNL